MPLAPVDRALNSNVVKIAGGCGPDSIAGRSVDAAGYEAPVPPERRDIVLIRTDCDGGHCSRPLLESW